MYFVFLDANERLNSVKPKPGVVEYTYLDFNKRKKSCMKKL